MHIIIMNDSDCSYTVCTITIHGSCFELTGTLEIKQKLVYQLFLQ